MCREPHRDLEPWHCGAHAVHDRAQPASAFLERAYVTYGNQAKVELLGLFTLLNVVRVGQVVTEVDTAAHVVRRD